MKTLRILYALARADFLERVRRYGFLLVLAATIYLGFAINHGDLYLELDGYRGLLNSAWVGGMMTACAGFLLTLFGFFLVKNAIERDIQTGVGQIIATTPISRPLYLLGKWLSNWAVLAALLAILALAAVIMQLLGGESVRVDLFALLSPFILLVLPSLAVTAALAILFETIPWLRGGFGNVAYFFVWIFSFIAGLETNIHWLDFSGIVLISQSMGAALRQVYPAYTRGFNITEQALPPGGLKTFEWSGIEWTAEIIGGRLLWLAAALGLALLGSLFFRRFDPSYERARTLKKTLPEPNGSPQAPQPEVLPVPAHLGALPVQAQRFNFMRVLLAELRLLLKGLPWWWLAGCAALSLAAFFNPLETVRQGLLPAAWLWPVLIWSGLGCREWRHATRQIVFSAPHPLASQIPAAWLAGFLTALLAGSGAGLRLLFAGDAPGMLSWLAGAMFIPALALALGVWSNTSKVFEVVYVLWWYLGPLHPLDMPALDFTGIAGQNYWTAYLFGAVLLFILAVVGRWRQIRQA